MSWWLDASFINSRCPEATKQPQTTTLFPPWLTAGLRLFWNVPTVTEAKQLYLWVSVHCRFFPKELPVGSLTNSSYPLMFFLKRNDFLLAHPSPVKCVRFVVWGCLKALSKLKCISNSSKKESNYGNLVIILVDLMVLCQPCSKWTAAYVNITNRHCFCLVVADKLCSLYLLGIVFNSSNPCKINFKNL